MKRFPLLLFQVLQCLLAARVFQRMAETSRGTRIFRDHAGRPEPGSISVILPVLDEAGRIVPCLEKLRTQGAEVREIIVVDGGSTDGTRELVLGAMGQDSRILLIEAACAPELVNGKAYGLMIGASAVSPGSRWVATIDADVRVQAGALGSMVDHARREGVRALSVATAQRIDGGLLGLLHPSMLTTLVYRFGIPGHATAEVDRVQANGQCFLIERCLLERLGGFGLVLDSICEDVTLARAVAALGEPVGFYESEGLVAVEMYRDGGDAWRNWPRSLPVRDRFSGRSSDLGLVELALVQAAPPLLLVAGLRWLGARCVFTQMQAALAIARIGVLAGTARAYPARPWTYWFSPLADLPVVIEIVCRSRRRVHTWRGRVISIGADP